MICFAVAPYLSQEVIFFASAHCPSSFPLRGRRLVGSFIPEEALVGRWSTNRTATEEGQDVVCRRNVGGEVVSIRNLGGKVVCTQKGDKSCELRAWARASVDVSRRVAQPPARASLGACKHGKRAWVCSVVDCFGGVDPRRSAEA